jgi:D-threonate/D-erythronate kinase
MASQTFIVADDLTGAQDTAIQLKRLGRRIEMALSADYLRSHRDNADIWAIDTETRFSGARDAYEAVFNCCRLLDGRDDVLYKKVDSTLRGNIGAEIEAALRATGKTRAIVAPALPHSGRTVLGGRAFVAGEPLHETECGRDPFTPVPDSDVSALISAQTALRVVIVTAATVRSGALQAEIDRHGGTVEEPVILVCDSETGADLAAVAALRRDRDTLFVGSSGLAAALFAEEAPSAAPKPFLVVVGSLNSVSHEQADRLVETHDCLVLSVDAEMAAFASDEARRRAAATLRDANRLGCRHVIVRCSRAPVRVGDGDALAAGQRIANCLSLIADDVLALSPSRRLMMTGGELAARFLKTVAAESIRLVDEAEPGVPYGVIGGGARDGYVFFSKAGGCGDPGILCKIVEREIP